MRRPRGARAASQAEYARLSALVQLRLEELRARLDRHEESGRWDEQAFLQVVERGLADIAAEVPEP